jgi:hypothetical protein
MADQSLQRWGRNLNCLEEYGDEVAALFRQAEQAAEKYRQVAKKIQEQASSELPVSPRLVAEVEAVTDRAERAASADDWKAVAADAGVLPGLYRMEHETDEDRLDNPRGSQQAEMRADVTATAGRVHDAFNAVAGGRERWVSLVEIRARLADLPREEVDAALRQLADGDRAALEPEPFGHRIGPAERDAAIYIGGEDRHLIKVYPPEPPTTLRYSTPLHSTPGSAP